MPGQLWHVPAASTARCAAAATTVARAAAVATTFALASAAATTVALAAAAATTVALAAAAAAASAAAARPPTATGRTTADVRGDAVLSVARNADPRQLACWCMHLLSAAV